MGQKYKRFREFRTPFSLRDIRKNPRSIYARVPQVMAQFVLKIEKLSHIMVPTPILKMARAYGLRPRLWLLIISFADFGYFFLNRELFPIVRLHIYILLLFNFEFSGGAIPIPRPKFCLNAPS